MKLCTSCPTQTCGSFTDAQALLMSHGLSPAMEADGAGAPACPVADLITQAMIARYKEVTPLAHEYQRLKEQFKVMLAQGASVEPGPYTAWVDIQMKHQLSQAHIFRTLQLTPAQIADLRKSAPLVRYRYLHVAKTKASASQAASILQALDDDDF